jgi:hypothetical protein
MPIIEALTAAKAALDISGKISDLVNRPNIDVTEVRANVHQMLIHLVNAQSGLSEAQLEISELRQQLDERERIRAIEADLEIEPDGQYYYRKSERSASKQIQYCPVCWGDKDKLVPLTHSAESTLFECGIHKTKYCTKVYIEALKQQQSARTNRRFSRA